MNKFYKYMFFLTMISGTLISMSSYSWMSMWIGLEINLLAIIPLLKSSKNIFPSESAIKYFITQAITSAIIMFTIVWNLNYYEYPLTAQSHSISMILSSALLTKMGAAPFHFWFPEVMDGLNWTNNIIMLTWQKIAPFILIMYNMKLNFFFSVIIISSAIIGGIMGLNQISIRKIMAYSSINHIAWMLSSLMNSHSIWLIYFTIYSFISLTLIINLINSKCFFLKQMYSTMNMNKSMKLFFLFSFLSLGGLPPFLGFFPKWLTINNLIENKFYIMSLLLIMSTLITLFFYIRITFSSMTLKSSEFINNKFIFKPKFSTSMINSFNLTGLILCMFSTNMLL
uniref:NADH-ubiquinone oxidoreductase chain 2 n=1 Tax=Coleoptera sp. 2 AH-2016 TaxID=1903824 RepID=A0A343C2F2_9COLE|nr:NADH dehydrogenase subunit 2 [Coleoptera sp. 2 AH-2016]